MKVESNINHRIKLKICGLRRIEDIHIVNQYMPDYAGFIINFPKSFRSLTPEEVKNLSCKLNPEIVSVGVFVNEPLENVISLLENGMIDMAQLHGNESEYYIRKVKEETGKPVVKAFLVQNTEDLRPALDSPADYILLDAGRGGGKAFDWEILHSKRIERPFFLAGGLSPENLEEALEKVQPYAVDMSSGVETDRWKNKAKIQKVKDILNKFNESQLKRRENRCQEVDLADMGDSIFQRR